MKSKNISIDEIQELIPFIDHQKTYDNSRELINFAQKILNTYSFYYIKEITAINEIQEINFNEIVEIRIHNFNEEKIHEVLEVASKILNETEKIYFYYVIMKGHTKQEILEGKNNLNYVISNCSRIKKAIIHKFMFSIQSLIEYK